MPPADVAMQHNDVAHLRKVAAPLLTEQWRHRRANTRQISLDFSSGEAMGYAEVVIGRSQQCRGGHHRLIRVLFHFRRLRHRVYPIQSPSLYFRKPQIALRLPHFPN